MLLYKKLLLMTFGTTYVYDNLRKLKKAWKFIFLNTQMLSQSTKYIKLL